MSILNTSPRFLAKRILWRVTHHGNQVTCPFCATRLSEFMPGGEKTDLTQTVVGQGQRRNCVCPSCKSYDRERHVFMFLETKKLLPPSSESKMLHVAPEANLRNKFSAMKNLDYVCSDLVLGNRGAAVQMDITQIDFDDNYFDFILCNHVLEHVIDDRKAMKELCRVLKPRGFAILQVPFNPSEPKTLEDPTITSPADRLKMFGQEDHVRIYGQDYVVRLEESGFTVKVDRSISENADMVTKYGLIKGEPIFFCTKEN